MASNALDS